MAAQFITIFEDGVLQVFKDGRCIIAQPFCPSSNGDQLPWVSEQEALEWWAAQQSSYDPPAPIMDDTPVGTV